LIHDHECTLVIDIAGQLQFRPSICLSQILLCQTRLNRIVKIIDISLLPMFYEQTGCVVGFSRAT